jgi:nucleotide-binding universal stress UspA family protein
MTVITDLFVPMLTYPDPTSIGAFSDLAKLVQPFANIITACTFEVEIPDVRPRLGPQLIDAAGLAGKIEADSRAISKDLIASAVNSTLKVIPKSARVTLTDLGAIATHMARHHDLALIALDPSSHDKRALAETLVFGAGRPAILAPEGVGADWDIGTVAIAWDGGRAASRAVHDAMPLLMNAQKVVLVTAFDDKAIGEAAVVEMAEYLERHGVKTTREDVRSVGTTVGSALQVAARAQGAGLLVMGAFGHSRLRDFVLGGATRSILQDLKMPVFLSH